MPSSDYLSHPFPQRHNQIFERLNDRKEFEVHVANFNLFERNRLKTTLDVHELDGRKRGSPSSYYLANSVGHALQLRKIIRQESIDVVVLSNLASPFVFMLLDRLSSMHVPIVIDLPDYYPTSAAGYVLDVKSFQGKILTGFFDLMLRQMMKRANLVTVASLGLRDYVKRSGTQHVEYVPNGISDCFLKLHDGSRLRERLGYSNEDFVIGYIGSVEFWLDMQMLFRGIAIARKRGLAAKLLVVGKSLHTGYLERVKDQIKKVDIGKNVTWLDFVPHAEVPGYMSAIDVGTIPFDVCNPTAFYSAPNKMWEYLSQKTPVISTPIPEALQNSDCLLTALTPNEYVRNCQMIFGNEKIVQEKTERGYEESLKRTWKISAEKFALELCQLVDA